MQFLKIVMLCVVAGVLYGVIHDQITVRISLEYFTIGHPRIIDSTSPTMLGLAWGVAATWWMGAFLGVLLALAARIGQRPALTAFDLVIPIVILLGSMALLALSAGIVGRMLAESKQIWIEGRLLGALPKERRVDFLTALWSHSASYLASAVGCVCLCIWVLRRRIRMKGLGPPSLVSAPPSSA